MLSRQYIEGMLTEKGYLSGWKGSDGYNKEYRKCLTDEKIFNKIVDDVIEKYDDMIFNQNHAPLEGMDLINMFKYYAIRRTNPSAKIGRVFQLNANYTSQFWTLAS